MNVSSEGLVRLSKVSHLTTLGCLCLLLAFPVVGLPIQTEDAVHLQDNSDWWSENRGSDSDENITTQERELAKTNFQVLGINLGETMFSHAAAKLGKVTAVQRGDASTGRLQACYMSPGAQDKVHLIFEQGEVEYVFYLFADGSTWEGAAHCVASKAVSRSLATGSGLHLGQTPIQVIKMLGKPTVRRENELVYAFSVKKKTSPQDLREARQRHPEMSDKDFQDTYGYYNLGAGLHAKFVDSKLTYLAVSTVESN